MFDSLPHALKDAGLTGDVRTLLLLMKSMERGLVRTMGDLYSVLKSIVVKDPQDVGPYTRVYYQYFLHIDIKNDEQLEDAVLRSETFKKWRTDFLDRHDDLEWTEDELLTRFLDEVHTTSYDIKTIMDGRNVWDKDNPDLEDQEDGGAENQDPNRIRQLDKMLDYSDLSMEELLERLEKIRDQQKSRHEGGSHWIGTGGTSPFGHGGAAKDGLRIGGSGGGKMARRVMGDPMYFPVDMDSIINDDNVDAALASLKGISEESAQPFLDVEETIKIGLKRGGLFIPELKNKIEEKLQVILLIDNGGYSMHPYIHVVRELFMKMRTRFSHDMETYYFHNTIYDRVWSDDRRSQPYMIDRLLAKDPMYRIFIIGDAAMAPYELDKTSLNTYRRLTDKFSRISWLNPDHPKYWNHTFTTNVIRQMIDMYPLSPRGIENAVLEMNRKGQG